MTCVQQQAIPSEAWFQIATPVLRTKRNPDGDRRTVFIGNLPCTASVERYVKRGKNTSEQGTTPASQCKFCIDILPRDAKYPKVAYGRAPPITLWWRVQCLELGQESSLRTSASATTTQSCGRQLYICTMYMVYVRCNRLATGTPNVQGYSHIYLQ